MQKLTEQIFKLSAPYDNPYQGKDKRVVFVCSAGLLRSATAANIYAAKGYNTRAAGSESYALVPLSVNLIAWADIIVFVNKENYVSAVETFKGLGMNFDPEQKKLKEAVVLDINDVHWYKAPALIKQLEEQLDGIL